MNAYLTVLRKYADFSGRARRSEYWMFVLVNLAVAFALAFLGALADSWLPYALYVLATLVPSIAVAARRLHDTGRSGWWMLLAIVPLANIALLVFVCLDSAPGENRYGPNPKGA